MLRECNVTCLFLTALFSDSEESYSFGRNSFVKVLFCKISHEFTQSKQAGISGPAPPPYFGLKKEEMTERKMAAMASKSRPGPPLAQGLDPPLGTKLRTVTAKTSDYMYLFILVAYGGLGMP